MFLINDVLVNEEIYKKNFICNLEKCKGACCWKGDFGAPLEEEEIIKLEKDYVKIAPHLTIEAQNLIKKNGFYKYYEGIKKNGTELLKNAHCVFLKIKNGIGKCGIEEAYENGKTDFKKPISCHLYPIRVDQNKENGFDVLKYDEWEICSAACELGDKKKVRIFFFLKDALIRKYGPSFYSQLDKMTSKFDKKI